MPATLLFYRSADSETQPEYFGAVTSGPPHALHYQVQRDDEGVLDWQCWWVQALAKGQFDTLERTHVPYEPPDPVDQAAFLGLLKACILPPLPL